jgi:hypothetical protein
MVDYFDFVQIWCISLTFAFASGAFKMWLYILVSFGLIQNFEILDFVMAKVEKVSIAITYKGLYYKI